MYISKTAEIEFDIEFYGSATFHEDMLENSMLDLLYQRKEKLNSIITLHEIIKVVHAAKNGKSIDIDQIPYES